MKRLALVLLTSLMATPLMTRAQNRELGTLFFTPDERSLMDRIRRGDPVGRTARGGEPIINGFVKRSDGQGTIWIDGREIDVKTQKAAGKLQPGIVGSLNEAMDIQFHNDLQETGKPVADRRAYRPRDSGIPSVPQK